MSNTAQSKAADRIAALLDDNSFVEIGSLVTARSTDFNLSDEKAPSDGVITGYGLIDDSLVYVYSQDASVLGGSIGEMHARKIARLYDLAMKMGAPVIGLLDSAGMRLQESTDALNAFGALYRKMALASGVIPQITAVLGNCGGGLAVAAGLSDFVFMEGSKAKLFVNSPNALAGNKEEDTASAQFQSEMSGLVDFVGTEEDILAQVRTLVSILPANNADEAPVTEAGDDLNRVCEGLEGAAGDTSILLSQISDGNLFCEVKAAAAKEMVTGFIKLNGTTVGAVANRTEVYNAEGEKEADFWIEEKDGTFSLHLHTITIMNSEMRSQLLSSTTSGKNVAAKGILGKLRDLLERTMEPADGSLTNYYPSGWVYTTDPTAMSATTMDVWSFNQYRESIKKEEEQEKWDELEKSISGKLADEVKISIMGDIVDVTIYKKF